MRKTVIRVRFARLAFERLPHHALRVASAPQPKQDRREHAVGANTRAFAGHRTLGKLERLGETAGAHQPVGLEVGSRCGSHRQV